MRLSPIEDMTAGTWIKRRTLPRVLGVSAIFVAGAAVAATISVWNLGALLVWVAMAIIVLTIAFPRTAFFVLVLLMPLDAHLGNGLFTDLFVPARLVVAVAVALRLGFPRPGTRSRPIGLLVIAYIAAVLISMTLPPYLLHMAIPFESYRSAYQLASSIAFGAAALVVVKELGDFQRTYWFLVAGICLTTGYEFYQVATSGFGGLYSWAYPMNSVQTWSGRPSGLLSYANSAAGYLNLVLPLLVGVTLYARDRLIRIYSALGAATCCVGLLLTQSRGGWLAAATILALMTIRFAPALLRIPTLIIIAVGVEAALLFVPFVADRIQNIEYTTGAGRPVIWKAAWSLFTSSPIFGTGYGSFQTGFATVNDSPIILSADQAHNLYLNVLAETGVLGFVAFAALMIMVLVAGWRAHVLARKASAGFITGLYTGITFAIIGVLVHGSVDVIFAVSPQFSTLFWLLVFLACIGGRDALPQEIAASVRSKRANLVSSSQAHGAAVGDSCE